MGPWTKAPVAGAVACLLGGCGAAVDSIAPRSSGTAYCAASTAAVPSPRVAGPIAATAAPGDPSHSYPFFATSYDIGARGYVEQEFFIDGAASVYTLPSAATGTVESAGHPYKTRIVVRRPTSAAKFNGIAIVEWFNVTNGWDSDTFWYQQYEHYMRQGYAYVGVSAQPVGVNYLKGWNPDRYGTLDVDENGATADLQYDIFSQAVEALRCPGGVDPLNGLPVRQVIAVGDSQSATQLTTYYNSVHPLAYVVDGFFLRGNLGNELRGDLPTKALKSQSETEVWLTAALDIIGANQPDSEVLRTWETTGTSHGDYHQSQGRTPNVQRDVGASTTPAICVRPPLSHIPYYHTMNAALEHLVRWVDGGAAPPASPRITQAVGAPAPTRAIIVRDANGNAEGGIRLPEHDAPTATNTGENAGSDAVNCVLRGSHEPFNAITLFNLYPDHEAYVAAVTASAEARVAEGFLLQEDADESIRAAGEADVPGVGSLQEAVMATLPP
jgi:hypothetical protein